MKVHRVELSRRFEADLDRHERSLLEHVGEALARVVVDEIVGACERLAAAPHRGADRGAVRSGLLCLPLLRRGTIAFAVDEARTRVIVLGWWRRGARIAAAMRRYRASSI